MKNLEEGMILIYHTCDGLNGIGKYSTPINPHDEHYLVEEIKKDKVKLYNLDNRRIWNISKSDIAGFIYFKKMEISEERG